MIFCVGICNAGGGGGSGARHGAGPTIDDYSARTDVKISLDGFGGGAAGAGGSGRGGKGAPKLAPKPTLDSWRAGQAAAAAQPVRGAILSIIFTCMLVEMCSPVTGAP